MICTPTRIIAMGGGLHVGSSSTPAWVSRDGGASWTDATSTPFDPWANDPVNHTSFYAPVAAPSDGSSLYHGYSISEAMNALFNVEVSPDDGKTSVPLVLNVQKPTGIDYITGPISVGALNARTLWVVLDRWSPNELTPVLEVTYDQGHTWREITPPE